MMASRSLPPLLLVPALLLGAPAAPAAPQPAARKEAPVKNALESARKVAAAQMEVPARRVKVEVAEGISAPGLVVFRARDKGEHGMPGSWRVGVVHAGGVDLDPDSARRRVLAAWGYGPTRPVPAVDVARASGFFEGAIEPTRPVLDESDVAQVPERWRSQVFLPREVEVDGRPGVEYWNRSPDDPLWLSVLTLGPGGEAVLVVRSPGQAR